MWLQGHWHCRMCCSRSTCHSSSSFSIATTETKSDNAEAPHTTKTKILFLFFFFLSNRTEPNQTKTKIKTKQNKKKNTGPESLGDTWELCEESRREFKSKKEKEEINKRQSNGNCRGRSPHCRRCEPKRREVTERWKQREEEADRRTETEKEREREGEKTRHVLLAGKMKQRLAASSSRLRRLSSPQ